MVQRGLMCVLSDCTAYRNEVYAIFTGKTHSDPQGTTNPGVLSGNTYKKMLGSGDSPESGAPVYLKQGASLQMPGDNVISHLTLVFDFGLDVSAATTDGTVGPESVYTIEASSAWKYDGSGDVGGEVIVGNTLTSYVFRPAAGGGYKPLDDTWSTKHRGQQYDVPDNPNFTDVLNNDMHFKQ